jgi:fructose-1-phosphate kinase PfkB-like protein
MDALISGYDIPNALIAGTAAGAANAMIYGAGFCTAEAIESLKSQVTIARIA